MTKPRQETARVTDAQLRPLETLWPLHPEQKRILFAQARIPSDPKYNVGGYVQLVGAFDREAFCRALAWFWNACDAERMAFPWSDEEPRQIFHADAAMPPPLDLDFTDDADPREAACRWMQGRMDTAFLLSDFPLFEHALIAIDAQEIWYFGRHHHILADAYAFSLKISRVLECYAALAAGEPMPAARLASYRAEIDRARTYAQSPESKADLAYWRNRLRGLPAPVWPRSADDAGGGGGQSIDQAECVLAPDLCGRLIALAAQSRTSALHLLLAALAAHFARTAGCREIIVGVPVHNRTTLRQKQTFGVMSAIVPTRLLCNPGQSFLDNARSTAIALAEDLANRHVPLWEIIKQVRATERSLRPLFQVIVNYEPFVETRGPPGLAVTTRELSSLTEHIPLHVRLCDFGGHQPLALRIQMMRDLIEGDAEAFATAFQATLKLLIEDAHTKISDIFVVCAVDNPDGLCC